MVAFTAKPRLNEGVERPDQLVYGSLAASEGQLVAHRLEIVGGGEEHQSAIWSSERATTAWTSWTLRGREPQQRSSPHHGQRREILV